MQPRILGRYEVGRVVGRGGAGQVHEAVLVGPGGFRRRVALKVLHRGSDALRREARIGGLLRHPNLVDVYEVGEVDGQWFCALELCDGTLAEHTPLSPRAVVEAGLAVCAALQYAHEDLGLVHLDVKPQNLLYAKGVVKVADLGIATAEGFESDGRVRGTPVYMPPEQRAGGPVDARTDVYALGLTLYELATGLRPMASDTLDIESFGDRTSVETYTHDEAVPGLPQVEAVPDWLAPVLARCLAEDPADRYPSMAALAQALEAIDASGPPLRELVGGRDLDEPVSIEVSEEPMVGRGPELAALLDHLSTPGLVTLRGPAGIGKSHLARVAAATWARETGQRSWICDCTGVASREALVMAVGAVLEISLRRGDVDQQVRRLAFGIAGRGPMLLVLDGLDRGVSEAGVVAAWIARSPQARVVITSRIAVGLDGERVIDVPPLGPVAATELIAARALERGADVAGDPDLPALAERLDGVPLALELAAGRIGVLTVRDVLDRLGLSMLRSGTDDRHGTLRNALDWSWETLTEAQRRALAQLSVFAGDFELTAAEAVVQVQASALETLEELVAHSMLATAPNGRFRLLSSVREYASERLDPSDGAEIRHGAWYARYGEVRALRALGIHGGVARFRALSDDFDEVLLACRRAIARRDGPMAEATTQAAWKILDRRGPLSLVLDLVDRVLELPGLELAAVSGLHRVAGSVHRQSGRYDQAEARYRLAMEVDRSDRRRAAGTRELLGLTVAHLGRKREALDLIEGALEVYRACGDRRAEGQGLGNLASTLAECGEKERARQTFLEGLTVTREVGNRFYEGICRGNLGVLSREMGRLDEAREHLEAALAIHREVGNRASMGLALGSMGVLAVVSGDVELAERRYREAIRLNAEVGNLRMQAGMEANLALLYSDRGDWEQMREGIERATAIYRAVEDPGREGDLFGRFGEMLGARGRLEEALEYLDRALEVLRPTGLGLPIGRACGWRADVLRRMGRLQEADRACLEGLESIGEGSAFHRIELVAGRARVLADLGRLVEASALADQAVEAAEAFPGRAGAVLAVQAQVRRMAGDAEGAARVLQRARGTEAHGRAAVLLHALAAAVAMDRGDLEIARSELAAAEADPLWGADRTEIGLLIAKVRGMLGP